MTSCHASPGFADARLRIYVFFFGSSCRHATTYYSIRFSVLNYMLSNTRYEYDNKVADRSGDRCISNDFKAWTIS